MALAGRGLLAWYNARLTSHPYSVKALGTGATYVASDCTAQAIEGEKNVMVQDRAARALKFGAVGCFWVGPLLTYWFNVMERFLPGRAPARVAAKLVIDQVLQGPFMIGSMFALCAAANGASVDAIQRMLEAELWPTWVNSVIVWGPVQIGQQVLVPLKYRVAVANGVSYVWDTYLSLKMMPPPAEAGTEKAAKPSALVRRRTIV